MNLPKVPTLGHCDTRPVSSERHRLISAQGNRSWMALQTVDSKSTTNPCRDISPGSSLSMALRIYKYFKNHKSCFNTLIG